MDNNFDPDAYIAANTQAQPFDPDAYLSQNAPDEGAAMAAGRGALRNFPLAQQATAAAAPLLSKVGLADKPDYSGELQHLTDAAEQAKAQHPVAYDTGAAAGTLAPLALPVIGEAGEGAAAALGAGSNPIVSGALTGAEQAISDTNIAKNPGQAAGQAALGGGLGAGLGYGLSKAVPALTGTLEKEANKSAVQSTIFNRNYLGHLDEDTRNEIGQFMRDHGLVNHNTQEAVNQARIIKDQYGRMIDDIGANAAPMKDALPYIQDLAEKAGKYEDRFDPEFKKLAGTYNNAVKELSSLGPNPSFGDLQELKTIYGDHAFNADHSIANKAAADVYFTLRDMMLQTADEAAPEYKSALKGFAYSNSILDGLEKKEGSLANAPQGIGMGSISRVVQRLPGPVRALGGAAAVATGHPYIAGMAALPEIMNPALQSEAASGLAKALPSLNGAARLELANALESRFGQKKP